ncbi:hypothetical protein GOP47_0014264 [Adiantum capillus-veneris]|uniref:Sugar phosphate transporter domain-containing protein n=1 Tax=Adiantum capillus-veneris TaxID=13818 RepID=A0A9D4UL93_ADICA|nr:hypothetical protein GOP47_0014264 [Adiantum capillus-veneris]
MDKVFKYFISKDVQKLLKRKDSDAGDRTGALEELQVSFLSAFHTAEGAKRQQQRLCGPWVALSFNFFIAVAIILTNKLLLGKVGFNFPIALTLAHYVVSWIFMAILNALSLIPGAPASKTPLTSLVALGVIMSFASGLANVSLKYNSVGFYQMAKLSVTPTIVFTEWACFRKRISFQKALSLAVVSFGVAIATVTDVEFNLFGAMVALAWIVPSAANKILWSTLQQRDNWTALAATCATTHVVLGQFKTCVILLGGFLLFEANPGAQSLCGATMALSGMAMYTFLNLQLEGNNETSGKQVLHKQSILRPHLRGNKLSTVENQASDLV